MTDKHEIVWKATLTDVELQILLEEWEGYFEVKQNE